MVPASDAIERGNEVGSEERTSLWAALHDAELVKVTSDALARSVVFELDILHLREFEHLSPDVRWRIIIDGATRLLARVWQPWPGPCPSLDGLPRDQQSRIVEEYQSRGRRVSIAWDEFERAVTERAVDVGDANLQPGAGVVAFSGYAHGDGDRLFELEVVGVRVRCERSDLGDVPLQDLCRLGERYWEALAARRPSTDSG